MRGRGRGKKLLISVLILLSRKVFETYLLSPFQLFHIMHQYFSIRFMICLVFYTVLVYTITDTIESRMFFPIITLRTKSGKQGTTVSQSILKITRHTCQTMSSLVFGISTVFLSGVRFNNCF